MTVDSPETVVETVVNTLDPSAIVWGKIDFSMAIIGTNRLQRRGVFILWCVVDVADGSNEASIEWYHRGVPGVRARDRTQRVARDPDRER